MRRSIDIPLRSLDLSATAVPSKEEADRLLPRGTVIADTYEIGDELGRGAMGAVYVARDRRLGRTVAIKMALAQETAASLRAEAAALAAVEHPGTVTVHAAGVHEGLDFVVMELLRGVTLEARLEAREKQNEPFAVEEIVRLGTNLAEALAAIHRAGLTHGDLKPANIVLCPPHRVVVMDLGLSLPEYERGTSTAVTGTPAYMAPEVITGSVRQGEGPRIDLYSLGIVLYELATLKLPFNGDTLEALFSAHLINPVPDLCTDRDDVPRALAELVQELLAKDVDDRPATADIVARRLSKIAASAAVAPGRDRVLVVDDDPKISKMLVTALKATAPTIVVDVAGDADEALKSIRRATPGLMLLDLDLPRTNGLELYLLLRERGALEGCTTVLMSARAADQDVQLLLGLGVQRFVPKDHLFLRTIREVVRASFGEARSKPTT
ncbi:MAG: protein kinase domain-containing protein [Polyangiales bacterium]